MPGALKVQEIDQTLTVHKDILHTLKENLFMDWNHMKKQAVQVPSE
jgi:hypothetical protein